MKSSTITFTSPKDGLLSVRGTFPKPATLHNKHGIYEFNNVVGVKIKVERDDMLVVDNDGIESIEVEE